MDENIILTGPPRSGTTLICHLLNKLPNIVALHEPMYLKMFSDKSTALVNIARTFEEMRTMIIEKGKAVSKVKNGKIPSNPFETGVTNRESIVKKGTFKIQKQLSDSNFKLVIKHNGHFIFMLRELTEVYPCYTTIRNPLAILASWNSINAPVNNGNLNVLERLDHNLYCKLNSIPNLFERQAELLNDIYKNIGVVKNEHIIKYENLVASPASELSVIHSGSKMLTESLVNRNENSNYNKKLIEKIGRVLLGRSGYWSNYYSNQEIEKLIGVYV